MKSNVFVKPNEQHAFIELCHGEKRRLKSNVFVKPNEQHAFIELCHSEKAKDEIYGPNETVQLAEQFGG